MKIVVAKGDLGNQMFGYAFYLFLKRKYRVSFVGFDIWGSIQVDIFKLSTIFSACKINSPNFYHTQFRIYNQRFIKSLIKIIDDESFFSDKAGLFTVYDGFWQSQLYFESIKADVRAAFLFDESKLNSSTKQLSIDIVNSNSISIHIRRGDYLQHADIFGGICTVEYYTKAIEYVLDRIDNCSFFVFSDDIDWVKLNFSHLGDFKYVDCNSGMDSWQDMYLMSKCKHNIIANSTFSWWGAWLNENPHKIVVAPAKWMNTRDCDIILPETWIKVEI